MDLAILRSESMPLWGYRNGKFIDQKRLSQSEGSASRPRRASDKYFPSSFECSSHVDLSVGPFLSLSRGCPQEHRENQVCIQKLITAFS